MKRYIISIIAVLAILFCFSGVSAITENYNAIIGGDTTTGIYDDFNANELDKFESSDNSKYTIKGSWPNGNYDSSSLMWEDFDISLPDCILIDHVTLKFEWTKIGCMNVRAAKILIKGDDSVWTQVWSKTSNLPTSDTIETIDLTPYVSTPEDLENLQVKFQAWANAYGDTQHDWVEIELEYNECPTHTECNYVSQTCEEVIGEGNDECHSYSDCIHDICNYDTLTCDTVPVDQQGDSCSIDSDCYHTECSAGYCEQVSGEAADECSADTECRHNYCNYGDLTCDVSFDDESGITDDCNTFIPDCGQCVEDSDCNSDYTECDEDTLKEHDFYCDQSTYTCEETINSQDCYYYTESCSGDELRYEEGYCNSNTLQCDNNEGLVQDCYYLSYFCDESEVWYEEGFCDDIASQCDYDTLFDQDCDDGQYCNGVEGCEAGSCIPGTPPNCDDGIECTTDSCNEDVDSCDNVPNNAACDDENPCTEDICDVDQGCVYNPIPNCCLTDEDCNYLDDNYCNCCTDNYRMHDEGVCEENTCTVETTTIDNCDDYDDWTFTEWEEFTCFKTRDKEYKDYSCFEENDETYCDYEVTQSATETENINEGVVCDLGDQTCKDTCTIGQEQYTCQSGSCEFDIWTNLVDTNPFSCINGQENGCSEECGAECDEDSDCECEGEDGCVGLDYYDYPEYGECLEDCTCDVDDTPCQGPCKPSIIHDDPRCYDCVDSDGDGYDAYDEDYCPEGDDCDDTNENIHPGAEEICNDLDDDCDGEVDEGFGEEECEYVCIDHGYHWVGNGHISPDLNCCGNQECPGECEWEAHPFELSEGSCFDSNDNDCDGLLDCADPDCWGSQECPTDSDGDGVPDHVDECNGETQDNLPEDTTCRDWYFNNQNGCHDYLDDDGSTVCETNTNTYYTCVDNNVNQVHETYSKYCGENTGQCDGEETAASSISIYAECGEGEYCMEGSSYCREGGSNGDFEPSEKDSSKSLPNTPRTLREGPSKGMSDFEINCGDNFCVMPQELEEGIYYCPRDCNSIL